MWLATRHGFYSIVRKSPGIYHIRARVRADLENLQRVCDLSQKIERWPQADYRFRIIVGDDNIGRVFAALCVDLDYSNFKTKIAATPDQRDKLHAYHDIWGLMMELQQ